MRTQTVNMAVVIIEKGHHFSSTIDVQGCKPFHLWAELSLKHSDYYLWNGEKFKEFGFLFSVFTALSVTLWSHLWYYIQLVFVINVHQEHENKTAVTNKAAQENHITVVFSWQNLYRRVRLDLLRRPSSPVWPGRQKVSH